MSLRFETDVAEAAWVETDTRWEERGADLLLGPAGFAAYARVLAVPDPQYEGQAEAEIDDAIIDSMPGDDELVAETVSLLLPATSTPDDLRFLLWDGWPYEPRLPRSGRFDVHGMRTCALASGTIGDWVDWSGSSPERGYPPAFVWPADRAWCLAYDVDSHFLGVGGSEEAVARVLAESSRTAVPATRDDLPPMYG